MSVIDIQPAQLINGVMSYFSKLEDKIENLENFCRSNEKDLQEYAEKNPKGDDTWTEQRLRKLEMDNAKMHISFRELSDNIARTHEDSNVGVNKEKIDLIEHYIACLTGNDANLSQRIHGLAIDLSNLTDRFEHFIDREEEAVEIDPVTVIALQREITVLRALVKSYESGGKNG